MEVLEVCDEELDGRRTLHAKASIPWSVAIHAGSGSAAAQEVAKRGELLCQKMLPRVPIPRAPLVIGSPRNRTGWPTSCHCCDAPRRCLPYSSSKKGHGLGALRLIIALLREYIINNSDAALAPFEPAVDMQSGAAFVGGGVSIGAASAKVEWTDTPPSPTMDDAAYVLDLAPRVQAPDADDMLTAVAASTAQASCSFLHEVVALGLAENYARAHPGAPLPDRSSLCVPLDSTSLAALLVELFPERYCRRLGLGRSAVASTISNRPDAAECLWPNCVERPSPRRRKRNAPRKRESVLFNGDVHDGHWLFGRKHGPGAYDFVSGAKYEGKWQSGKMVGIGWYTKDGKRNLVDNRKKS